MERCGFMENIFSDRIKKTKSSFIREILKVTEAEDIISFAGGLPNPISFPKEELSASSERIIQTFGDKVFQYATTEGLLPLREYVANRYYQRFQLKVSPSDILITTGSQQGIDLLAKILINKGDNIIIEEPGYLGAIQAFSLCEPNFIPIPLENDGINLEILEQTLKEKKVKIFYSVPNFQNPTGISYSKEKREAVCKLLEQYNVVLVEDDPYSELRFHGDMLPYIGAGKLKNSVLFGTFSKTVTPGMRLGYICTQNKLIMQHLITAKQGSDLHTNIFAQYLIYDYVQHNDYETHIAKIKDLYKTQSDTMIAAMKKYFPSNVSYTHPQGGMFLWVTLKHNMPAIDFLNEAMKLKVAFVPGDPFYTNKQNVNTLRFNYTNSDTKTIEEGIRRLGSILTNS